MWLYTAKEIIRYIVMLVTMPHKAWRQ